jgi:hypothetical protein
LSCARLRLAPGQDKNGDSHALRHHHAGDPFTKAGLFEEVAVARWRKAYFNKQKFV